MLSKQLLELRPSRKRRREDFEEHVQETQPFSEDLDVPALREDQEDLQPGYVELPFEPGPSPSTMPVATSGEEEEPTPYEVPHNLPAVPEEDEDVDL